jgi:hypothetical protein
VKTKLFALLSATAICGFLAQGRAFAEDSVPRDAAHEAHHADLKTPSGLSTKEQTGNMDGGMMMDKDQMMGMMHECNQMHKDGEMCDHQMMSECQKKMGKMDCQKMMKQANAHEKTKAMEKAHD